MSSARPEPDAEIELPLIDRSRRPPFDESPLTVGLSGYLHSTSRAREGEESVELDVTLSEHAGLELDLDQELDAQDLPPRRRRRSRHPRRYTGVGRRRDDAKGSLASCCERPRQRSSSERRSSIAPPSTATLLARASALRARGLRPRRRSSYEERAVRSTERADHRGARARTAAGSTLSPSVPPECYGSSHAISPENSPGCPARRANCPRWSSISLSAIAQPRGLRRHGGRPARAASAAETERVQLQESPEHSVPSTEGVWPVSEDINLEVPTLPLAARPASPLRSRSKDPSSGLPPRRMARTPRAARTNLHRRGRRQSSCR